TGERLFPAKERSAALLQLRTADIPPPSRKNPEVPPALDALVLRALARDPGQRFASAADLARVLASLPAQHPCTRTQAAAFARSCAPAPREATAPTLAANARTTRRRRLGALALFALPVLVVVAIHAGLILNRRVEASRGAG